MRLFSGLENSLEKYIEGFFKDKFSSQARVQPHDIAKKLARSMRDKRRVSVANIYVPNSYTVLLNSEDFESLKAITQPLAEELADYLINKAAEKEFTLVSRPRIEFAQQEDLQPGDFVIESNYEIPEPNADVAISTTKEALEPELDLQQPKGYQALSDTAPLPNIKEKIAASLVVEEGADAGKEFPLNDFRTSFGRRDTCDIIINDTGVSRRHAQVEKIGGRYWLTDLNSTNGTFVNGLPIDKMELSTGDVITVGNTVLIFKEF
ncbi:FhaA domain-containing protein [Desulforamulus aeronauticus]|uniref:Forkhead associated (FHA) domain, binds pSer, pThr, pTyr n=1 Tax=Desulforamulus aeronauticus DSM 10349 TaxID=1121421 RepID=A0A1M6NJJ3_9FIRM|nr:DUF3662 and FHA domain-containing protein [Desulforamulus aeronauticus]SHJ95911.1 Forkhead associated (FHA) domain, binds pSer, pThr, pTyr [Desulforamulus aeronauticus DSM 10349]